MDGWSASERYGWSKSSITQAGHESATSQPKLTIGFVYECHACMLRTVWEDTNVVGRFEEAFDLGLLLVLTSLCYLLRIGCSIIAEQ